MSITEDYAAFVAKLAEDHVTFVAAELAAREARKDQEEADTQALIQQARDEGYA